MATQEPALTVICHEDGTGVLPRVWDHLIVSASMAISLLGGVNRRAGAVARRFLSAPVGLSFDDEFVGGGGEPVDGGLGEQASLIMASHSLGSRFEVSTVELLWWRATTSS